MNSLAHGAGEHLGQIARLVRMCRAAAENGMGAGYGGSARVL